MTHRSYFDLIANIELAQPHEIFTPASNYGIGAMQAVVPPAEWPDIPGKIVQGERGLKAYNKKFSEHDGGEVTVDRRSIAVEVKVAAPVSANGRHGPPAAPGAPRPAGEEPAGSAEFGSAESPELLSQMEVADFEADTVFERRIMAALQLDVLGKVGDRGAKVFSAFHRRSEIISDVSKLSYEHLLLKFGFPVKAQLKTSADDTSPDRFTLKEVKNSIALLAGYKTISERTELGVGIWEGMTVGGEEYPSVVLVGAGEAAEWNGDQKLRKITHPRCRGHLLNFDTGSEQWYEFEKLAERLDRCTPEFAQATLKKAVDLFSGWAWKEQIAPDVLCGLILATWVQSIWAWRPQVALIGPSKSGKTYACNAISGIFGEMCKKSSMSTAAGIRQAIKSSSRAILCDEFEHSRYREEVLEMLRASGRGDSILRGTTDQKGQEFSLRHIVWVAAIEVGLSREADKNRFITLELARPPEDSRGKLILPSPAELNELGQDMLAVAIRYVHQAKRLAIRLKEVRVAGVDDRVVESYAVPAAMIATINGETEEGAVELLKGFLEGMGVSDPMEVKDETSLFDAILGAHVFVSKESYAVSQLLDVILKATENTENAKEALERCGIRKGQFSPDGAEESDAVKIDCLIIGCKAAADHLLRNTEWKGQAIEQILRRIEGAAVKRKLMAKRKVKCVCIPLDYVIEHFLVDGKDPEDSPPAQKNF